MIHLPSLPPPLWGDDQVLGVGNTLPHHVGDAEATPVSAVSHVGSPSRTASQPRGPPDNAYTTTGYLRTATAAIGDPLLEHLPPPHQSESVFDGRPRNVAYRMPSSPLHPMPRGHRGSSSSGVSGFASRRGTHCVEETTTPHRGAIVSRLDALSRSIPVATGGQFTRGFVYTWPRHRPRRTNEDRRGSLQASDSSGGGASSSELQLQNPSDASNNNESDDPMYREDDNDDRSHTTDDGYVYLVDAAHQRVMYHRPPPIHVPLSTVDDHVPYTVVSLPPMRVDDDANNNVGGSDDAVAAPPAVAAGTSSEIIVAVQPVGYRYHFYNSVLQAHKHSAVAVSSSTFQHLKQQLTATTTHTPPAGGGAQTDLGDVRVLHHDGTLTANTTTRHVYHYDDVVVEAIVGNTSGSVQQRQHAPWGFKTIGGDYIQLVCLPWYDDTSELDGIDGGANAPTQQPVVAATEALNPLLLRRRASTSGTHGASPLRLSGSQAGAFGGGASTVEEDILMHWALQRQSTAGSASTHSFSLREDGDVVDVLNAPSLGQSASPSAFLPTRDTTLGDAFAPRVSIDGLLATAHANDGVVGNGHHHHLENNGGGALRRRVASVTAPASSSKHHNRPVSIASLDVWLYVFYTFLPRCHFGPVRLVCRNFNALLTMRCSFWQWRLPPAFILYDDDDDDDDQLSDDEDGVSAGAPQRLSKHCVAHRIIRAVDHGVLSPRELVNAKCLKGCCHDAWRTAILRRRNAALDDGTMDEEVAVCSRIIASVMFPIVKFSPHLLGGDVEDNPTVLADMRQRHGRVVLWMSLAAVVAVLILVLVLVVSMHTTAAAAATAGNSSIGATDDGNSSLSVSIFLPMWVFAVLSYAVLYRFCMCSSTETIVMALFQVVSVQLTAILIASYCIDTATASVTSCMIPSILAATSLITYGAITIRHRLMDDRYLATYLRSPLLMAILLLKGLAVCGSLLFCIFLAADLDSALFQYNATKDLTAAPAPPMSGGGGRSTPSPFAGVTTSVTTSSQQARQRLRVAMATFFATARTAIPFVVVPVAGILLLVLAAVRIGLGQLFEVVPTVMVTLLGYVVSLALVAVVAIKCMVDGTGNTQGERESTYGIVMCAITSFGLTSILSVIASHTYNTIMPGMLVSQVFLPHADS